MTSPQVASNSGRDGYSSVVLAAADTSYFTVFVQDEIFGLSVSKAQTIFRIASVTPIPLGKPEIAGLVNLRGKVVTAVSLRRRLGFPDLGTFRNALAIGVEHGGDSFALVVDRIGDVLSLDPSSRIPMPPHFDPNRSKYTLELYRTGSLLIPILDVSRLFDFTM